MTSSNMSSTTNILITGSNRGEKNLLLWSSFLLNMIPIRNWKRHSFYIPRQTHHTLIAGVRDPTSHSCSPPRQKQQSHSREDRQSIRDRCINRRLDTQVRPPDHKARHRNCQCRNRQLLRPRTRHSHQRNVLALPDQCHWATSPLPSYRRIIRCFPFAKILQYLLGNGQYQLPREYPS
jgi:hypothetical protein